MNRLSQLLGAAAVIAIAVVFIVQFRPATEVQGGREVTCAVELRGDCVSSTHFWASYRLLAPRNADEARLRQMALRRQVGDGLIERWLLVEDAKRLGIAVSEEDLNAHLTAGRMHVSLPADKARSLSSALGLDEDLVRYINVKDKKTKRFDTKTYDKEVKFISKMSTPEFREFQRQELLASRMRDLIRSRVRVSENEAFEQFSHEKSTATLSYVKLERKFYADLVVDANPKAVSAWAETSKAEVDGVWEKRKAQFAPECRVARQIVVEIDPVAPDADAAKAEARKKIEAAAARVEKGDSFAAVARSVSDDEATASRGGDLGCVQRASKKQVEEALLTLEEGKVSQPLETENGFILIKVEKIAKGPDAEAIGRQQTEREMYLAFEAERLATEGAKQILAATRGGKSLEDALKDHLAGLHVRKAEADPKPKKPKDGEKKPKDGDEPSKVEGREALTVENHPGRPAVEATLPFNLTGDPIPGVKPGTNVAAMAFALEKPGDVPADVVPLDVQRGFVVFQLKEKAAVTPEQWEKEREYYLSAMRSAKQQDALVGYVKRLRGAAQSEIKQNETLLTESKAGSSEGEPAPEEE